MKIQHNLADYLGCEFHLNKVKTRGWLGQPSIIKSLEQKFGMRAMKERLSLTPGTPRFTARRLENPEDKVRPCPNHDHFGMHSRDAYHQFADMWVPPGYHIEYLHISEYVFVITPGYLAS